MPTPSPFADITNEFNNFVTPTLKPTVSNSNTLLTLASLAQERSINLTTKEPTTYLPPTAIDLTKKDPPTKRPPTKNDYITNKFVGDVNDAHPDSVLSQLVIEDELEDELEEDSENKMIDLDHKIMSLLPKVISRV